MSSSAVHPNHHRLRSTSDPFSDPVAAQPRLPYDAPAKPSAHTPVSSPRDRRFYTGDNMPAEAPVDGRSDSPRAKMSRSQTQAVNATKAVPSSRRTHSQDSVPQPTDKSKSRKKDGKSAHADAIDRLDFSGVGPALFHHDGPFDACAPSRNKHRTKAPMLAWGLESNRDDPMAAAARVAGRERKPVASATSPYAYDNPVYTQPKDKKKVDAIAEAWGIHEPEPYEEFFSGGYSQTPTTATSEFFADSGRRNKDDAPSRPSGAARRPTRTNVPPPQPVMIDVESPSVFSPGSAPKRSTSIMGRFRKMRDSPNVPMNDSYRDDGYDQDRLAGRFAGMSTSPTSPESVDGFVNVQDPKYTTKDLPITPAGDAISPSRSDNGDYFEGSASPGGLGRKGSLLRKMKGAVRGGR